MIRKTAKILTIDNAMNFTAAANKCEGDVTLYSGRYIVNGKSMMGLMSIDLTSPIEIEYSEENKFFTEFIRSLEV